MNIKSTERKEKNVMQMVIEVEAAEYEAAINEVYMKNKGQISVPGFRKGKAPRKVIENYYGADVFRQDARDMAFRPAFESALLEKQIDVAGRPIFELVEDKGDSFTFKALMNVFPEVTLGEYKNLVVEKPSEEVTDEDVENELLAMQKRNARQETVDRPLEMGDTAIIDFVGYDNGVPFDGGDGERFPLEIGSGQFVPGFEDQLVGMKAGEERSINVTFPEDYQEDLAGKPVVFEVKLQEVKAAILPELDDEFAKDVSEADTLEELRKNIREHLEPQKKEEAKHQFEDALIEKAVSNMQVEITQALIDAKLQNMLVDYEYQMAQAGIKLEQYLQMTGTSLEDLHATMLPQADRRVKLDLLASAIAKKEGIVVTKEDVEAEYAKMAEAYQVPVEQVRGSLSLYELAFDMKASRAMQIVMSTGVAAEGPVEEAKPAKKPAAKKTTKKAAEKAEEGEAKKPAAKKTTKKAAEKAEEGEAKKPAAKKTTKKAAEKAEEGEAKKPAAKKTTKKAAEKTEEK